MTESGFKLVLWVVAAGVTGAVLAIPQPVSPWEMPSLVLDRAAVSDAIGLDKTLAKEAPVSEEARSLQVLFLDHGRSEVAPSYERREYDRRQVEIHHATEALIDKHGAPALEAMRASAVEDFVRVFSHGGRVAQDENELGVVGGMTQVLEQYGALRDGVVVAPPLTLRVFYKARWNSVHRRPFVEGFSPIELQAYWGWLALHAWGKPLDQRKGALLAFRDAGGSGTQEAAALFNLLDGRPDRASKSLIELYRVTRQLRLRNIGLGALHAALLPASSP